MPPKGGGKGKPEGKGKAEGKGKGKTEGKVKAAGGDPERVRLKRNADLCVACEEGDTDKVIELLANGADKNSRVGNNPESQCALHRACCEGHLEIARILLDHGADISAKSKKGYTALHFTSMLGLKELTIFLISRGASLTSVTKEPLGRTPLHVACLANTNSTQPALGKEICEILVSNGSSLDALTTKYMDTPLHHACFKGFKILALFLASKGADIYAKDSVGLSPLDYAKKFNFGREGGVQRDS